MERESREQLLRIEGMTCAGCAQAVERALSQVRGVKTASVNLLTEEARVKHYRPCLPRGTCCRGGSGWVQSSTDCQPA
ncbi:heavy-metal-associated domain-containing protein [Candidatus Bipolaricaulota bacterium]|nr:heavy-metal-associated domain-containing protein [Candidatus Bipolaricaulota bacterium]